MATINQNEVFRNTTAQQVYNLLMDEALHTAFSGAPAKIENKAGGVFSTYDEYATGTNLELEPGKKIVQTWRASDWEDGADSTVTYELKQVGDDVELTFTQTGVPDDQLEAITQGWTDYYWDPIKDYLDGDKY